MRRLLLVIGLGLLMGLLQGIPSVTAGTSRQPAFDEEPDREVAAARTDADVEERSSADSNAPTATFTVNSTLNIQDGNLSDGICSTSSNGTGVCTLFAAIQTANQTSAHDTINFNISGAGPHVFQTTSGDGFGLPIITEPVTINGISQSGASCPNVLNTADLRIVLSGDQFNPEYGLRLSEGADNSVIRGLVIIDYVGAGVRLQGADSVDIECNHIGVEADGTTAAPNGTGINVDAYSNNTTIGGTTSNSRTERNVISGNSGSGIFNQNYSDNTDITGNYIGTSALGTSAVPNGNGIWTRSDGGFIGGFDVWEGNVISGNSGNGIRFGVFSHDIIVINNKIGTDVFGVSDVGNQSNGILVDPNDTPDDLETPPRDIAIGLTDENEIAFNDRNGIVMLGAANSGTRGTIENITIIGNSIHSNGQIGIDLGNNGVTANDFLDADDGPNSYQNYGYITSAVLASGTSDVTITGGLNAEANTSYRIDLYSDVTCHPSGFGEGQVFREFFFVTTNGNGFASFTQNYTLSGIDTGDVLTLLTTKNVSGDAPTSEFSACTSVTGGSLVVNNLEDDPDLTAGDGVCDTSATAGSQCSLRAAIQEVNAAPAGLTIIEFDVNVSDPESQFIKLQSPLPTIVNPTIIDGVRGAMETYGASCKTNTLLIHVNGSAVGGTTDGLTIAGDDSSVLGLIITEFTDDGVQVNGDYNTVACNRIGLSPDGTTAMPNGGSGVRVTGENNTIGGAIDTLHNVISGNDVHGVYLSGGRLNTVLGNYVGTDAGGTQAVGNGGAGVRVENSMFNLVGGDAETARNIISGNAVNGVFVFDTNQAVSIIGNYIGTDAKGLNPLGNGTNGVHISGGFLNTIRGNIVSSNGNNGVRLDNGANLVTVDENIIGRSIDLQDALPNNEHGININSLSSTDITITGNTIASNNRDGVRIFVGARNTISQNDIYDNGQLGIDLGDDGVLVNDAGDGDVGANTLLNYPELMIAADNLTVVGTLETRPNSGDYTLEFFHNTSCDPSGNGEGERYIGSHEISIPGSGTFQFTAAFFYPDVPIGDYVTATATDADGNTSEFSECLQVTDAFIVNAIGDLGRDLGDGQCNGSTGSALGGTACTLRNAIEEANAANLSSRTIYFAIEGAGPHIITPQSPIPSISDTVVMDGVTYQDGASCPIGLKVLIDGRDISGSTIDGFNFTGSSAGSTVRGLMIGNFPRAAINVRRTDINIECNGLGVSVFYNGASADMPNQYGVMVQADRTTIGGNSTSDRNTIGNNTFDGISILYPSNNSINDTTISRNYIGVSREGLGYASNDRHGVSAFRDIGTTFTNNTISGNMEDGVNLGESTDTTFFQNNIGVGADQALGIRNFGNGITLGGTSNTQILGYSGTGAENIISFNGEDGIYASEAFDLVVTGNTIGMGVGGEDRGNAGHGIHIDRMNDTQIGGLVDNNWGSNNLIFYNGADGIAVTGNGTGNRIAENWLAFNDGIGIDLDDDGVTVNDGATDPDSGSNRLQNYPLISSTNTAGITSGTMFGPNGDYDLFFYNNDNCDSSGHGEGQRIVGGQRVTISSGNQVAYNVSLGSLDLNSEVTAVAVNVSTGDTSEFSPCVTVEQGPPTAVALSGQGAVVSSQWSVVSLLLLLGLTMAVVWQRKRAA